MRALRTARATKKATVPTVVFLAPLTPFAPFGMGGLRIGCHAELANVLHLVFSATVREIEPKSFCTFPQDDPCREHRS